MGTGEQCEQNPYIRTAVTVNPQYQITSKSFSWAIEIKLYQNLMFIIP